MIRIALIVEGHGDAEAVPLLVQRLALARSVTGLDIARPAHRLSRGKMAKREELARAVEFQARRVGAGGVILIVLDADDDCPAELGPRLLGWAAERSGVNVGVVVAKREYEAWFVGAARSLSGQRGLPADLAPPDVDIEAMANPKRWLSEKMGKRYSETLDQPALTARMDLEEARHIPSFDKLWREMERLLSPG